MLHCSLLIPKAWRFAKVGFVDSKNPGFGFPLRGLDGRRQIAMTIVGDRMAEMGNMAVWSSAAGRCVAGGHVACWTIDLAVLGEGKAQALA